MKKTTKIANAVLWVIIGLLVTTVVLLRMPTVQRFMGEKTAEMLSEKLGTQVSVGRVDVGFLNRITIDGSSFAVIHQIDGVLNHTTLSNGRYEVNWNTPAAAKMYLKRFAIR